MTTPAQHEAVAAIIRKWFPYQHDLATACYADEIIAAYEAAAWQPIETAPRDGSVFYVWAPGVHGLPSMHSLCSWHADAGFCIDELRDPTVWRPLLPDPTP